MDNSTFILDSNNIRRTKLGNAFFQVHKPKTLLIEAVFTEQFYQPHGYYDNMKIRTVGLNHSMTPRMIYSGSKTAFDLLSQSFSTTNDIEVTRHPEILQHYDRIILLHNEYVSKVEYDAIIRLPNVFYLYPNAYLNPSVRNVVLNN